MKILKFIILGAATTGLISSSTIIDNTNEEEAQKYLKQHISQNINQLIKEQHDIGFLRENPQISFEIVKPIILFNEKEKKFEEVIPFNNVAYVILGKRKIVWNNYINIAPHNQAFRFNFTLN